MKYDICMVVKKCNIIDDGRVMKEARSLVNHGFRVAIVGWCYADEQKPQQAEGIDIKIVSINRFWMRWRPSRTLQKAFYLPFMLANNSYQKRGSEDSPLREALFNFTMRIQPHIRTNLYIDKQIVKALNKVKPRAFHAHDYPALDLVCKALENQRNSGSIPVVYDSHEIFFDQQDQTQVNSAEYAPTVYEKERQHERALAQQAARVITVGEGCAAHLAKTLEVPHPLVIHNAVDLRTHRDPAAKFQAGNRRIVVHSGHITGGRHLPELVTALKHLPQDVAVVLMGNGRLKPDLQKLAQDLNVDDRLFFVDPVASEAVASTLAQADVGAVLITNQGGLSYQLSMPNKLFECIAAGLPVVVGQTPEIQRVVEEFGIGLSCDPNDPQAVAQAILHILDADQHAHFRQQVRAAQEVFSWEHEEAKLVDFYQTLLP